MRAGRPRIGSAVFAGAIASVAAGLMPAPRASGDVVERRGSEPRLEGEVRKIDDAGVLIVSPSGAQHLVTWDRIREVHMTRSDPKVEHMRETAVNLWRARSRLERGDAALAEPLFERLFAHYRGQTHETALIVAEGLLRCRLARGGNDLAVMPALEAARLRRKSITTIAYSNMPSVMDDATGLCTRLPPYWANTPGLARLESELKSYDSGGDPPLSAIAALYRTAIRQQIGAGSDEPPQLAADQPGVALMRHLTDANHADGAKRESARQALEQQLPDLPVWAQAWARYAIGLSLLGERGVGRQQAGMVSLAWLPAAYEREQPYLAALALAQMSGALARQGDNEGAAALRNELQRLAPNHPALSSLDAPPRPATRDGEAPASSPSARRSAPPTPARSAPASSLTVTSRARMKEPA